MPSSLYPYVETDPLATGIAGVKNDVNKLVPADGAAMLADEPAPAIRDDMVIAPVAKEAVAGMLNVTNAVSSRSTTVPIRIGVVAGVVIETLVYSVPLMVTFTEYVVDGANPDVVVASTADAKSKKAVAYSEAMYLIPSTKS